ncbi:hypothetical protein [Dongia rigui]|uniref:Uncharacterized protein n=1 Tax=Dongia rigui TaxID=940149 RepID=A0ABU5E1B1_9PROT|nr:hypothetical protein [Dongia rigui]MDY0873389.1 hypothetical protein [Dongia rigui]
MIVAVDIAILISAALSAWFWWKASGRKLRRISYKEVLDARDINRIIVTINRGQILNARAALATAISAGLVAVRFFITLLEPYF